MLSHLGNRSKGEKSRKERRAYRRASYTSAPCSRQARHTRLGARGRGGRDSRVSLIAAPNLQAAHKQRAAMGSPTARPFLGRRADPRLVLPSVDHVSPATILGPVPVVTKNSGKTRGHGPVTASETWTPQPRPSRGNVTQRHEMAFKDDVFEDVWSPILNFYRCGCAL